MERGYWHSDRGYWQTISEPSQEILDAYPEGTIEVELKPGPLYHFDGTQWIAPTEQEIYDAQAEDVRNERNRLLRQYVDPVVSNALRWEDLTVDEQEEVKTYRRALLDITLQEGFPSDVTWPTMPSVLEVP